MPITTTEVVFVATDADGDKLEVKFLPLTNEYFIVVSGEDGHRAVVFKGKEVDDLVGSLRHHREANAPKATKAKRAPSRTTTPRRRPVGDGLDSLRSLLP